MIRLDLEKYICPREALDLFIEESGLMREFQGIPTAIGHHSEIGWFVIQTSGQGPYLIWQEKIINDSN